MTQTRASALPYSMSDVLWYTPSPLLPHGMLVFVGGIVGQGPSGTTVETVVPVPWTFSRAAT